MLHRGLGAGTHLSFPRHAEPARPPQQDSDPKHPSRHDGGPKPNRDVWEESKVLSISVKTVGQPFQVVHLMKLIQRWSRE